MYSVDVILFCLLCSLFLAGCFFLQTQTMDEPDEITKTSFCYGCLCKNDESSLLSYSVQNETLKTILQVESICLCYLCKRRAQQVELFIQNVQSNQLLLENFESLTDSTLQALKDEAYQPLTNLTHIPLDTIELSGSNEDISAEESYTVVYNSWKSSSNVKIKLELKDEDKALLDDINAHFMDDNDDGDPEPFTHNIKAEETEEDDYPLKLLKEELELEGISIKCLRKSMKKGKLRRRKHKDKKLRDDRKVRDFRIETISITREQCMAERSTMCTDKRYLNSVYKCIDCIKGFNFESSFERHLEKHSQNNGDYECDICKQRFNSEDKLNSHRRYHSVRYKCPTCNLTRVSRMTIKDHYTATHCNGFYQYACQLCSKVFKRQVSLRKHVTYVHKMKERVQCGYCSKTYASKEILKTHLIVRHPSDVSTGLRPKRHVCEECGMAFSAPSQLRNHGMKHSQRRDYYCVECDKSFKSNSILKHHLKTAMPHTNYLELPLQCLHCDKRFAIKRDLDRHTNRVHLNIKPFQCDKCEKAYVNAWSLNEHKRLVHEGYKRPLRFPCPMCDKVFDRNQILKGHIRTHTGERPFQCSKCPARFSQASILGTHMRLIHLKLTRDGRPKAVNSVSVK